MNDGEKKTETNGGAGFSFGDDFVIDFGKPKKKRDHGKPDAEDADPSAENPVAGGSASADEADATDDLVLELDDDLGAPAPGEAAAPPEPARMGGVDLSSLVELDLSEMLEPDEIIEDSRSTDGEGRVIGSDAPAIIYGEAPRQNEESAVKPSSVALDEDEFPDIDWADDDDAIPDPLEEVTGIEAESEVPPEPATPPAPEESNLGASETAEATIAEPAAETDTETPPAVDYAPTDPDGADDFDDIFEIIDESVPAAAEKAPPPEMGSDTEPDAASAPEREAADGPEPEPEPEPQTKPEPEATSEPAAKPELEPESDTAPEAAPAPAPKPAPLPSPKPEVAPPPPPAPKPIPQDINAVLRDAVKLHGEGKLEEASALYRKLIAAKPDMPGPWINLGVLLRRTGHLEPAIACLRRGVSLKPGDGSAWSNLGNAFRALNRLDQAEMAQRQALECTPSAAQIHYNLALVLRDKGELEEAFECFDRARLLGYKKAELVWDRALTHLLAGDLTKGFQDYEARWDLPEAVARHQRIPRWKGARLRNRAILVWSEQGFGDSINFSRYVPMLKKQEPRAIAFEVQPALVSLLKASPKFKGIEIIPQGTPLKGGYNFQVPLLSLPGLLGTELNSIPTGAPYVSAPPKTSAPMPKFSRPAIGLCWAGKPSHRNDRNRSLSLEAFSPLLELSRANFYALQKGPRAKDIATARLDPFLQDLSPAMGDFADTAALINELDLVITADTAVAHLAGALGKPVWVLLPFAPDWRWMLHRDDSPWYPSMTLFRQTSPGDWQEVFARARRLLSMRLKSGDFT